jgi:Polyketide cyclase / dehydrase and lipid transport
MANITGTIDIARPVEEVFDVVADQRNEPRYNPDMLRAEKTSPGRSAWARGSRPRLRSEAALRS